MIENLVSRTLFQHIDKVFFYFYLFNRYQITFKTTKEIGKFTKLLSSKE